MRGGTGVAGGVISGVWGGDTSPGGAFAGLTQRQLLVTVTLWSVAPMRIGCPAEKIGASHLGNAPWPSSAAQPLATDKENTGWVCAKRHDAPTGTFNTPVPSAGTLALGESPPKQLAVTVNGSKNDAKRGPATLLTMVRLLVSGAAGAGPAGLQVGHRQLQVLVTVRFCAPDALIVTLWAEKAGGPHLGTLPLVQAATASELNDGSVSLKLHVVPRGPMTGLAYWGLVPLVVMVTFPQFELIANGIAVTVAGPTTVLTMVIRWDGTHFQLLVTVTVCVTPDTTTDAAGE